MEWLGGTISKEDVGEDAGKGHSNRRRREDDNEDEDMDDLGDAGDDDQVMDEVRYTS